MKSIFGFRVPSLILNYLVIAVVIAAVWAPEFNHYYVPNANMQPYIQDSLRYPSQKIYEEVNGYKLLKTGVREEDLVQSADEILKGRVKLPGFPLHRISIPFSEDDLNTGSPGWKLMFAGLAVPDILLDAYDRTGEEKYFNTAKDMIAAWAGFESHKWLPKGFLWNDHAVAARITVLTKFWSIYRLRNDVDDDTAGKILTMVDRSAQILAKPENFTVATNHGVIQNIALLQLCLAFPKLPDVEQYKHIAVARLSDQLGFYIDDEGVVLEHSAGYHAHGVYFVGLALRYMQLLALPIPKEWINKYRKAETVYANFKRPDKSLPLVGDTASDEDLEGTPLAEIDPNGTIGVLRVNSSLKPLGDWSLYPVSGYSIWWRGLKNWDTSSSLAQTVINWSYFPGHGHKKADEMSVNFWADGTNWWSATGYWPYGEKNRAQAISWTSSNAPHLQGEAYNSQRETKLVRYLHTNNLSFIDLQRSARAGYTLKRQILNLDDRLWLVLDSGNDKTHRQLQTMWTLDPGINIENQNMESNRYRLSSVKSTTSLAVGYLGSNNLQIRPIKGSIDPFGGWLVAENRKILPTNAFFVSVPTDSGWAGTYWTLNRGQSHESAILDIKNQSWKDDAHWSFLVKQAKGTTQISRNGDKLFIDDRSLNLDHAPDISQSLAVLRSNLQQSANKYPKYRELLGYRLKISYVLLILLGLNEMFFFMIRRKARAWASGFRLLSSAMWVGIGLWLTLVYFET